MARVLMPSYTRPCLPAPVRRSRNRWDVHSCAGAGYAGHDGALGASAIIGRAYILSMLSTSIPPSLPNTHTRAPRTSNPPFRSVPACALAVLATVPPPLLAQPHELRAQRSASETPRPRSTQFLTRPHTPPPCSTSHLVRARASSPSPIAPTSPAPPPPPHPPRAAAVSQPHIPQPPSSFVHLSLARFGRRLPSPSGNARISPGTEVLAPSRISHRHRERHPWGVSSFFRLVFCGWGGAGGPTVARVYAPPLGARGTGARALAPFSPSLSVDARGPAVVTSTAHALVKSVRRRWRYARTCTSAVRLIPCDCCAARPVSAALVPRGGGTGARAGVLIHAIISDSLIHCGMHRTCPGRAAWMEPRLVSINNKYNFLCDRWGFAGAAASPAVVLLLKVLPSSTNTPASTNGHSPSGPGPSAVSSPPSPHVNVNASPISSPPWHPLLPLLPLFAIQAIVSFEPSEKLVQMQAAMEDKTSSAPAPANPNHRTAP
ncbi:hypothetical protein FB451DRAFT_1560133 [Mycena latifolia]|nr:hypothetical protein FB451DRAFT_1560133 [Mycena latifolia]